MAQEYVDDVDDVDDIDDNADVDDDRRSLSILAASIAPMYFKCCLRKTTLGRLEGA